MDYVLKVVLIRDLVGSRNSSLLCSEEFNSDSKPTIGLKFQGLHGLRHVVLQTTFDMV